MTRVGNPRSIQPYLRRIAAAGHATDWREDPNEYARLAETWWLGLRLAEGVSPSAARAAAKFAADVPDPALAIAERLETQGFLERFTAPEGDERFRLSAIGLPLADAAARQFLDGVQAD